MTLCANLGEWIVQWLPYPISSVHSGVYVPHTNERSDLLL